MSKDIKIVMLMKMLKHRKLLFIGTLMVVWFIVLIYVVNKDIYDPDREEKLAIIKKLVHSQDKSRPCMQPTLPVYAPELMKFVHTVPPINCSGAGRDWVICQRSRCTIQDEVLKLHGRVTCGFTDIIRVDDFTSRNGETTYSDSYYDLVNSDVVDVNCKANYGSWSAILTTIRHDPHILRRTGWQYLHKNALGLSVLIFGLDSISRNSFIRKLPKSYQYLTKNLKAIVLEGYNIVGDGTPQALIPILTGKTELELPDTRKRIQNAEFVDAYPLIWNDYSTSGYVTGFLEDLPHVGTFTYRLKGFKVPPTDHYMRPYYLASYNEQRKWPNLCTGATPRHQVMLKYIEQFFSVYSEKPKFLFGFHGELSHDDYNLVGAADEDIYNFLKNLKKKKILDDTVLIMMADHGHRFAEIRNTLQGKQEERMPFFSFRFPESFKQKFPEAYENFRRNAKKLTTPFDIHTTLKEVLNLKTTGIGSLESRNISLFSEIPEERSCAHAFIEPHWCACLEWEAVESNSSVAVRLMNTFISTLNDFTRNHRNICEILHIKKVIWVTKLSPNKNLVKFKKNSDLDGFLADMSGKVVVNRDMYQIKVELEPGDSLFEASLAHYLDNDQLELKMSDISRINMYGRQARCVEKHLPHLRKYCYCKVQ